MSSNETQPLPIGQLVWGKMKGYPYWPAKVIEPTTEKEIQRKNKQATNSKAPKEYFVMFFGSGQNAWLNVKDIEIYDCEKKEEFIAKSKNLTKLAQAIQEANQHATSESPVETDGDVEPQEISNEDELAAELAIINKAKEAEAQVASNKRSRKTIAGVVEKIKADASEGPETDESKTATQKRSSRLSLPLTANLNKTNNTATPKSKSAAVKQQETSRKRTARLPIQIDQLCTPSAKKRPRKQTSSEIESEYDQTRKKYASFQKLVSNSNYGISKSQETNGHGSDDEDRMDDQDENDSLIENQMPVSNHQEIYKTVTLVVDFNNDLTAKFVEAFSALSNSTLNLYNINKEQEGGADGAQGVLNGIDSKENVKILDNFEASLQTDGDSVVIAYLNGDVHKQFMNEFVNLVSTENRRDLKLIDFSSVKHDDVLFYHTFFKDNQIAYIEAPLLAFNKSVLKIYAASQDDAFFKSTKYLLDLITKNIVYKDSNYGYPSLLLKLAKPLIESTDGLFTNAFDSMNKNEAKASLSENNNYFNDCLDNINLVWQFILNNRELNVLARE